MGDPPEDRYRRDPVFKTFVDTVRVLIERAEMSPSEVREGAVLACIHYEQRRMVRDGPPWPRCGHESLTLGCPECGEWAIAAHHGGTGG